MKAAWYSKLGPARDVLELGEMPTPAARTGEVLVELHTSGVNPSDVKSRVGRPTEGQTIVPHSDGAGVVVAVGEGVAPGRLGERVWIWNGQWRRTMGTAAQFIALPQEQAVPLPQHVDFEAGACFGIPLLTAVQAVRLAGPIDGRTVLVTGGGSAVGHYITQIARLGGARVLATTGSPGRRDHARDAGAAQVIDYKQEDVAARVAELTSGAGVDAVIDMDFSTTARLLPKGVLKAHGHFVCYGSNQRGDLPIDFRTALWGSLTFHFFLVYDLSPQDREAAIDDVGRLLDARALRHKLGEVFPLDQVVQAHEAVEKGNRVGTVVLRTRG